LIALLGLQLRSLAAAWRAWDLPAWDGAHYYWLAGRVARGFLPRWDYSPGYQVYYAAFHLLGPSDQPFLIYFLQRAGTILAVTALIFLFLSRRVPIALAWSLAALCIMSRPVLVNEFVVHLFVVIPVLLAFLAADLPPSYATPAVLACLLLAYFVRPEFGPAFVLAFVLLMLVEKRLAEPALEPTIGWLQTIRRATVSIGALISGLLVVEVVSGGGGRSWFAFSQHFALSYWRRHPEWVATEREVWIRYPELISRVFGDSHTLGQAALRNPKELAGHLSWNLGQLPAELGELLMPLVPGRTAFLETRRSWLLVLPLLGFAWAFVAAIRRKRIDGTGAATRSWRFAVTVLAVCAAVLLSNLIVSSWAAYLLAVLPLLLLCVARLLAEVTRGRRRLDLALAGLSSTLLLVAPTPFGTDTERPVLDAVRALPPRSGNGPYRILADSAVSFCAYADPTFSDCGAFEIGLIPPDVVLFGELLEREDVQVIVTSPFLLASLPPAGREYVGRVEADLEPDWRRVAETSRVRIFVRLPRSR